MTNFLRTGDAAEAQRLIQIGSEDRTLFRACHHRGGEEKALIQRRHQPQIRADLLPQTGGGKPVSAPVNAFFRAADIAADGRKAAAGVLDEAAHGHVRANVGRLNGLHEFAIAVVNHDSNVGLDILAEGDQLADLLDGEGGTGGVALGALNGDELRFIVDGLADAVVVKASVGEQVYLPVDNAVFRQRAGTFPDADDLLQGVVGHTHRGEQLVTGQQVSAEGDGEGVGAAGDLGAHQRGLGVEHVGIDPLQIVPAEIVIAVASGCGEAGGGDPVLLHGPQHLCLIMLRDLVDGGEAVFQLLQRPLAVGVYRRGDPHGFVKLQ